MSPIRRHATFAALLAAPAVLAGCATMTSNPFDRGAPGSIRIEVQNLNFMDATLHAVSTGGRRRLGIVTGKGSADYTMEWHTTQPLQIEVDLLASDHCITQQLSVDPGDVIMLQIQQEMANSSVCYPPFKH